MTYACITTVAILVKLFCVDSLVTSFIASHFCRILFPFMSGGDSNISNIGLCRVEGRTDPDDYLDIESGEPASISPTLSPFLNPFSFLCFLPCRLRHSPPASVHTSIPNSNQSLCPPSRGRGPPLSERTQVPARYGCR